MIRVSMRPSAGEDSKSCWERWEKGIINATAASLAGV